MLSPYHRRADLVFERTVGIIGIAYRIAVTTLSIDVSDSLNSTIDKVMSVAAVKSRRQEQMTRVRAGVREANVTRTQRVFTVRRERWTCDVGSRHRRRPNQVIRLPPVKAPRERDC